MADPLSEFGVSGQATYLPEGSDYRGFSFFDGRDPSFPGPGYGSAPSRQFMQMMPQRDIVSRQNGFAGNTAMAPPGGINFGSPFANLLGNQILSMIPGFQEMPPFSRPNMSAYDYARSRERYKRMTERRDDFAQLDKEWLGSLPGGIGSNAMLSPYASYLNIAGRSEDVYSTISSRFGYKMGDEDQDTYRMVTNMRQLFSRDKAGNPIADGGYNMAAAFGFDRVQSAEILDASARYGIGGLSMDKVLAAGKDPAKLQEMVAKQNEIFATAGDVFGKDKGFDELANLMSKAIDGIGGLTPQKTQDLLQKIQSASRAVNMSTSVFAEYASIFAGINRSANIAGGTAISNMADSVIGGEIASKAGRGINLTTSDENVAISAAANLKARTTNSVYMNKATAWSIVGNNMTDSQKAAMRFEGIGNFNDFQRQLNTYMENGESAKAEALMASAYQSADPATRRAVLGAQQSISEEDRERFGGQWDSNAKVKQLIKDDLKKNIEGGIQNKSILGKLGKDGVLGLITRNLKDRSQLQLGAEGLGELLKDDEYFKNLSDAEKGDVLRAMGQQTRHTTNDQYLKSLLPGAENAQAEFDVAFSDMTEAGKAAKMAAQDRMQKASEAEVAARKVAGDALNGISLKKVAEGLRTNKEGFDKIFTKGGFDVGAALEWAKSVGLDATESEKMKDVMKSNYDREKKAKEERDAYDDKGKPKQTGDAVVDAVKDAMTDKPPGDPGANGEITAEAIKKGVATMETHLQTIANAVTGQSQDPLPTAPLADSKFAYRQHSSKA